MFEIRSQKDSALLPPLVPENTFRKVVYDPSTINDYLQSGDVVGVQIREKGETPVHPVDRVIRFMQGLAKLWMKGKREPLVETNVHVGIYVGDGKIAESTLGGTVVLPLTSEDWILQPGDSLQYRVTRLQNQEIADKAAEIARDIAYTPLPNENLRKAPIKHKYSILLGVNAFFHSASFGENAKRRLFAAYARRQIGGKESFYCSYFVGMALQNAEAKKKIERALEDSSLPRPPMPPSLNSTLTQRQSFDCDVNKWAGEMAKKHPEILDGMTMHFDSMHLSPQKLRSIIIERPEIFEDVMTIVPRAKSAAGAS